MHRRHRQALALGPLLGVTLACAHATPPGHHEVPSQGASQPDDHRAPHRTFDGDAETLTVESKILGELRQLYVSIPREYGENDRSYPVLYLLDGDYDYLFRLVSSVVEFQGQHGAIPEMIVVGITNTDRVRDFTPSQSTTMEGEDAPGFAHSGGSPAFLRFLSEECMPFIEARYRTDSHNKILVGHSLGGLFVAHTAVAVPERFDKYIAIDPAIWWDERLVLRLLETAFPKQRQTYAERYFYSAFSGIPWAKRNAPVWQAALDRHWPEVSRISVESFPAEGHLTMIVPALLSGLNKAYPGWRPDDLEGESPQQTLARMRAHYRELNARHRFDQPIEMPNTIRNGAGLALLEANLIQEAIAVFKENIAAYPRSFNAEDSLGLAYQRAGQLDRAIEHYERALTLNPRRAGWEQAEYKRVTELLRALRAAATEGS